MSGEVLRAMTLREVSIATSVLNGGSSSIDCQPSSNATRTRGSNLPETFVRAPRPRRRAPSTSVLAAKSAWGSGPTSHIPPAGPKCEGAGAGGGRRGGACRDINYSIAQCLEQNKNNFYILARAAARDLFTCRLSRRRAQFSCLDGTAGDATAKAMFPRGGGIP